MDTLQLLSIAGAAVVGGAVGAGASYWHMNRVVESMRQRLDRAEQARNGAIERSAQARDQIAQLNRAIDELRRTVAPSTRVDGPAAASAAQTIEDRRAKAEKALAEATPEPSQRRQTMQVFADTEVLPDRANSAA